MYFYVQQHDFGSSIVVIHSQQTHNNIQLCCFWSKFQGSGCHPEQLTTCTLATNLFGWSTKTFGAAVVAQSSKILPRER